MSSSPRTPGTPPIALSRFAAHDRPQATGLASWGPMLLLAPGLAALVADPVRWLWRSWHDPAYQSEGWIVAGTVAVLLAVSVASGAAPPDARDRRHAWIALALTAAVRLAGRLLAVHTVGALALVVDVWALAVLLGVRRRPFALHPLALALFFSLALPVEHLAQRLLGHPLQLLAAATSEVLLSPLFPALSREGVLLVHPATELAVDLPCSGARGGVLLTALALGLATRFAPGLAGGLGWIAAVLGGALAANVLRIVVLFVGGVFDVPVIEAPWHDLLGAGVLAIGAVPLLVLALRAPTRRPKRPPMAWARRGRGGRVASRQRPITWPVAALLGVAGVAIAHAPGRPLDVGPRLDDMHLPTTLGEFEGTDVPLEASEARYSARWGGFVQKRVYEDGAGAPVTALLVRTRSPLRHLHGPDVCLRGAGHEVTRLGVQPGPVPVVLHRSVAPDGRVWRVEASFVSDQGHVATSVSEVAWRWLEAPDVSWSLVERITPWDACTHQPERCERFEQALWAGLDPFTHAPPTHVAITDASTSHVPLTHVQPAHVPPTHVRTTHVPPTHVPPMESPIR